MGGGGIIGVRGDWWGGELGVRGDWWGVDGESGGLGGG